jgi:hypothetical protein
MTPAQVTPNIAKRVVPIEEMVFSIEADHPAHRVSPPALSAFLRCPALLRGFANCLPGSRAQMAFGLGLFSRGRGSLRLRPSALLSQSHPLNRFGAKVAFARVAIAAGTAGAHVAQLCDLIVNVLLLGFKAVNGCLNDFSRECRHLSRDSPW